jgi:hypothetical protein
MMHPDEMPPEETHPEKTHPEEESFYRKHRIAIWSVFALIVLLDAGMVRLSAFPGNDMSSRYAPMAEAFASGNWRVAFHPRFGLLFSAVTGSISFLTGLSGFRSCQVAAIVFFWLTAFPLWSIYRRIWDERVAAAGCFLYLMSSFLTRYAYFGLRESWKTFGIALGVCGVLTVMQSPNKWRGYLAVACGCAFLISIRGDSAFYALVLLVMAFVLEKIRAKRLPSRSFLCGLLILLLVSPQLWYNYRMLGYPVPESRHAQLLKHIGIPPLKTPEVEVP